MFHDPKYYQIMSTILARYGTAFIANNGKMLLVAATLAMSCRAGCETPGVKYVKAMMLELGHKANIMCDLA